ncbi:MAG: radical SAM family heme chaperone HemW [Tepidisphaera sp.]
MPSPNHSIPVLSPAAGALPHPLASGRASAEGPARSLYIHVPFCFHKCHYCDFYSLVDTRDRQATFTDRLLAELAALAPFAVGKPLRTIFVGGGTPSLLAVEHWKRLLATLADRFDLSEIRAGRGEFTVECNPETVSAELMETLRSGGVDRVSVGAQSFNPVHLKTLERWHDPANVAKAIDLARAAGIPRQSMDLIFGIPGQTLADWESDLRTALSIGTEHLSCYNLTYEPNTAMTKRLELGHFIPAEEEVEVEMFHATLRHVRTAGMDRYEVSNFAKPGCESQHNLAYWRQEEWLAAGPSASGHIRLMDPSGTPGAWRWKNVPRLDDYLKESPTGLPGAVDVEGPDALRALVEKIMTGVRISEGLDGAAAIAEANRLRPGSGQELRQAANRLVATGELKETSARWSLTDKGWLVTNTVVLGLVEAVDPD